MNKWELWDYFDVWGNADDGYEVNNLAKIEEDIVLADDTSDDELIDFLIRIEYLTPECSTENIEIVSDVDYIELFRKDDHFPICCFRRQYNG